MTAVVGPELVAAKVAEVLKQDEHARAVALAAEPVWPYDAELALPNGGRALVRPCVSTLAIRDELQRAAALQEGQVLVLLTTQETGTLGHSITARLARQRVVPLDRWQQLKAEFHAREIDPLLVKEDWAVEALLAAAASELQRPAPGGYLDRESALATLAEIEAGLTPLDLDLAGLLRWSLDGAHLLQWRALTPATRQGLSRWLISRSSRRGAAIEAILRCIEGPYGADTVAVGLVLAALSHDDVAQAASVPRTMLETRAVDSALDVAAARDWGTAAEGLIQRMLALPDRTVALAVRRRAEQLLAEQGAGEFSYPSAVLESGLAQRLRRLATTQSALLRKRQLRPADLRGIEDELTRLKAHTAPGTLAPAVDRAEMAVRLLRWLAGDARPAAASVADAARRQQDLDAWVDIARARIWDDDGDKAVVEANRVLCRAVDARRDAQEHRFADLLVDYVSTGSTTGEVLGVEDVVGQVVLPLAATRRLLMLVIDGMSTGVARELLLDLAHDGWVEHSLTPVRPVLSAFPSVTRVSRTSLLCGKLTDGTQATERAAFSARGWPLFHKGDLGTAGAGEAISAAVRAALAGTAPVVGIVVNTVDDALDKGGRTPWTAASVDKLPGLLRAADEAGRAVLLVSDHGHVHERGSRLAADGSGGARWRLAGGTSAGNDEVVLTGSRVLLGGGRIVAAWNERLRYTDKKNGYHGGASPQEVVIPLALLARTELGLAGWAPRYHPEPRWWIEPVLPTTGKAVDSIGTAVRKRPGRGTDAKAAGSDAALPLDLDAIAPVVASAEHRPAERADGGLFDESVLVPRPWVERVLTSETLQARLAGTRRGGLPADRLEVLLRVLHDRGGTAMQAVLARELNVPKPRVAGQIVAAQRILNIDGYEILRTEGDTVTLNSELLETQLGLR